jgi:hypothetical protein
VSFRVFNPRVTRVTLLGLVVAGTGLLLGSVFGGCRR